MLALAALALAFAAPVHCDSGATMYVDGPLRIFGKGFHRHEYGNIDDGHDQYACLGRRGPLATGEDVESTGAYGAGTDMYVFAGGRYLAAATYNYGEGGGDQSLDVRDLRTGKLVTSATGFWDEDIGPQIGLSANGDLLQEEPEGSFDSVVVYTRRNAPRTLSTPGANATSIAVAGTTVYWTEPGGPRSAVLEGQPSEEPEAVLAPVAFSRNNACDSRAGRTLLRTPRVRVARRGKATFACRVGDRRAVTLPRGNQLGAAGDRWLSVAASDDDVEVLDLRTRRVVTKVFMGVRHALLPDGTLVVNDGAGLLQAYAPGAAKPTVLEQIGAGALATSGTTVYWTDGGAAHSWIAPA